MKPANVDILGLASTPGELQKNPLSHKTVAVKWDIYHDAERKTILT